MRRLILTLTPALLAGMAAAAGGATAALAQQPCWEGTAPSCLPPVTYPYAPPYAYPYAPPYAYAYPRWSAAPYSNYAPFENSSHAYVSNPR